MHTPTSRPRLTRDRDNAMLGGVCAGIAKRYGYDPTVVRVAAVLLSVAWGAGIVVYLALWVLMPAETPEAAASDGTAAGDPMSAEVVALGAAGEAASAGASAGGEDLAERARRTAEELAVAARNAAEAARVAADQLVVAARAASAAGRESWEQQRVSRGAADASAAGEASEAGAGASEAGAPDVAKEREQA